MRDLNRYPAACCGEFSFVVMTADINESPMMKQNYFFENIQKAVISNEPIPKDSSGEELLLKQIENVKPSRQTVGKLPDIALSISGKLYTQEGFSHKLGFIGNQDTATYNLYFKDKRPDREYIIGLDNVIRWNENQNLGAKGYWEEDEFILLMYTIDPVTGVINSNILRFSFDGTNMFTTANSGTVKSIMEQ